jgi:hypothetical protein
LILRRLRLAKPPPHPDPLPARGEREIRRCGETEGVGRAI